MPIFEYKCKSCGEDFEKLVFGNKEVSCPKCSSKEVKKKFSVFSATGTEKPLPAHHQAAHPAQKARAVHAINLNETLKFRFAEIETL